MKGSMSPKLYTRRAITVTAIQWDGTPENASYIIDWLRESGYVAEHWPGFMTVDTLSGMVNCSPTDWIVKDVGETYSVRFYVVANNMFTETYEATP